MLQLSVQVAPVKNAINFRDLGGISTKEGRKIRSGLLFRAGDFSEINSEEQTFIANQLNIQNILDYRDINEAQNRPDNIWKSSQYFNVPANPLSDDVTATLTQELTSKLKKYSPVEFMIQLYQLLPFNNPAYKKLVHLLLNNHGQSLVQHCAIGKDRTGVGVALTLFILGVDEHTIMADYLLSDQLLAPHREKLFAQYKDHLTDKELEQRKDVFEAKEIYLQSAIDAIKSKYQTIDNWLELEFQLTANKRQIIQNYYLT